MSYDLNAFTGEFDKTDYEEIISFLESNYVPYTGANANVDIGNYNLIGGDISGTNIQGYGSVAVGYNRVAGGQALIYSYDGANNLLYIENKAPNPSLPDWNYGTWQLDIDGTRQFMQRGDVHFNKGFTIADDYSGTLDFTASGKTLYIEDNSRINQDLTSDASVSFNGLSISGSTTMTSVSTGTSNNDKMVTQGYVDDAGGTSVSFGLEDQIPVTNAATDDFDYSANLTFDGSVANIGGGTATWTANAEGIYTMNENAASTTVSDTSGNSNDGTASTNTSNLYNASGKINSCFTFTGSESIDCGDVAGFDMSANQDISISVWVKYPSDGSTRIILDKREWDGTNWTGYVLYKTSSDEIWARMFYTSGSSSYYLDSDDLGDDAWHHIVAVFDRDDIMRMYVDGHLDNRMTYSSWADKESNDYSTSNSLTIGEVSDSQSAYSNWDGEIDAVYIFSRALTSADVLQLYNDGSGKEASSVSYTSNVIGSNNADPYWISPDSDDLLVTDKMQSDKIYFGGGTYITSPQDRVIRMGSKTSLPYEMWMDWSFEETNPELSIDFAQYPGYSGGLDLDMHLGFTTESYIRFGPGQDMVQGWTYQNDVDSDSTRHGIIAVDGSGGSGDQPILALIHRDWYWKDTYLPNEDNPTLYVLSKTDPTSSTHQWIKMQHDVTDGIIKTGTGNIKLDSSNYVVLNSSKATTGDPTGEEGMIYINTTDNVVKIYADSGWRTIASW